MKIKYVLKFIVICNILYICLFQDYLSHGSNYTKRQQKG